MLITGAYNLAEDKNEPNYDISGYQNFTTFITESKETAITIGLLNDFYAIRRDGQPQCDLAFSRRTKQSRCSYRQSNSAKFCQLF